MTEERSAQPPTHPGRLLLDEFLRPLGVSQTEFAEWIGVSYVRLNSIVNGRRGVTPDTALRLERATGFDADFWLGMQLDWDLWWQRRAEASADIVRIRRIEEATDNPGSGL